MYRGFNSTQRNYIIAGLCAILVIMGVGYAAFASQLRISGTSSVTGDFSVKIISITPSDIKGNAADKPEITTHTDTTATFGTSLELLGDSITYNIVIENQGNIDAVLKTINKTDAASSAILFETSGVNEGDILVHGDRATMKVKVTYNPNVTTQPESLESTLSMTLDYAQAGTAVEPGTNNILLGGKTVSLVDSGDGLYADEYEAGRYIYRGQAPNNYIEFNDELWRIVSKESDGTYKIIRNDVLENRPFDEANHRSTEKNTYCTNPSYGCGVYAAVSETFTSPSGSQRGTVTEDSSIKAYLNGTYYSSLSGTAKNQMTSHLFNIGAVEYLDESGSAADSISKNIAGEKMYTWSGNVGLANVSDILRASINPLCTSATISFNGTNECSSNYLLDKESKSSLFYWTINAYSRESGGYSSLVWIGYFVNSYTHVHNNYAYYSSRAPRPVVFLKSTISLDGKGTKTEPYTIS